MSLGEFMAQAQTATLPQPINAADWLTLEPDPVDAVIPGVFDRGDKTAVIASSKRGKSFFALQMSICIATGREFVGLAIPKPRRVLLFQLEIQPHHFHRRVRRMCRGLGVGPGDFGDRFLIVNGRGMGLGFEHVHSLALAYPADVVVFDPFYKLTSAGENDVAEMKAALKGFDTIAHKTGAAVVYVHHDGKGTPGDRDVIDRGAGSGVLSRDYDAAFILTAHASEETASVVEIVARNYAPVPPSAVLWDATTTPGGYRFVESVGIAPVKRTSTNRPKQRTSFDDMLYVARELLTGPMTVTAFKDEMRGRTGEGRDYVHSFYSWAVEEGHLETAEERGTGRHAKLIKVAPPAARCSGFVREV